MVKHISNRESFLEPETRAGTFIGSEMKAVFKCMLDMAELVLAVCDEHGLRCYPNGGTLIGAARHGGFIPWDDDLDLMMPREDYEKLQTILPNELPPHLFMQTSYTDKEFMFPLLKIRDCRTSAIDLRYVSQGLRFNMGIFIDIFPIDGYPEDDSALAQARQEVGKLYRYMYYVYGRHFKGWRNWARHFKYALKFHLQRRESFLSRRERIASKFRMAECTNCAPAVLCFGYDHKAIWPSEWVWGGGGNRSAV